MAFFKLRKAAAEQSAPAPAPESVDALRRRARYRLAGATLLVLAGVIGFPLLFDNQPRPIAVDIPIDIPDKAKVKPLDNGAVTAPAKQADAVAPLVSAGTGAQPPQAGASRADSGTVAAAGTDAKAAAAKDAQKEEVFVSVGKPAAAKAEDKPAAKVADKPADKATAKAADKPDAKAKPADKPAEKSADKAGRFVVQFGAFTDSAKAHEARVKVEKTGLKTYAQIAETPEGKKFRVRVGPFEKRSDAEKAAEKIKKLDLPAAILGL